MDNTIIRSKITIEDVMHFDEDKRIEVVNGEIKDNTVTAGFMHAHIIENLRDIIKPVARKNKLGHVFGDGLTYILYEDKEEGVRDARIPDFSFVRPNLIPKDWDRSRPFPGCPALAVEVVSPTEKTADLMGKIASFLRYDTEQVWVIYPQKQELHQYVKDNLPPRIYTAQDTLIVETLFPELEIKIASLFVDDYE
ncbi:MAG: Uma2 family endonuclease [Anaerolineae bacterium]|nr:Uma2 family endonuclease [Anaerolineae bacterium]MDQ7035518.1 Uma2 family endonuclease [Anaerolineae bacterium]